MKRIELNYLFNEVHVWFSETYGMPLHWTNIITEPKELEGKHWAVGSMLYNDGQYDTVACIWCDEEAYTMYSLRWQ